MELLPADDAAALEACRGERAAEQHRRKRLRQHQQTDQQQQQQQALQREQQQDHVQRQQDMMQRQQQEEESRDVPQRGLLRPRKHLERRATAEQAASSAARLAEGAASTTSQGTAAPAAVNPPQQREVLETRQVQQPRVELSVNQKRTLLSRKEHQEGSELRIVEKATQQLRGPLSLGGLVSRNVLSPRVQAWHSLQRKHSSLEEERHRVPQPQIREYTGPQQQLSQDLHARSVSERQPHRQPVELAESPVDFAREQAQQRCQQHEAQQHSGVRQRWGPPFDTNQEDDESLEDVLAAIAEVEDEAEAPTNVYPLQCAEQPVDDFQEKSMRLELESPQREPACQKQQSERGEGCRQRVQQRKSEDELQQEEQLEQEGQLQPDPERQQDTERQQQDDQREKSVEPPSVNPCLPHVREKPQTLEQRASDREALERLYEAQPLESEDVCQEQCFAETQQLDTQQLLEQQPLSEAEGWNSQQQQQGRELLHSHRQGNWKETSMRGESCLQRELLEFSNQQQGELNDAQQQQQQQQSIQQASSLDKHHSQERDVLSTPVIVPRPRKLLSETDLELDDEICDFLEAGLSPAAVTRWSDYLCLRQQQQQLQEQQQRQVQQQQRYRQHERHQRQTVSGELSFFQTAATPPRADPRFRPSAGRLLDERLRTEAFQSATSCMPCYPESLISAQTTPRQAEVRTDRGPCSSSSPSLTSRIPRVYTSPRSATAARFASSALSSANMLRRSSGGANNDSTSNVEDLTNSRTGDKCSSGTDQSSEVHNGVGRRNREPRDRRGSSSSNSARIRNEDAFHSCDTPRNAIGVSSSYSRFLDVRRDISAVYERALPRPTFHSSCSTGAQVGDPTTTPGTAPAPAPCGVPFLSTGVHSKNPSHLSASSAPSGACSSPKSPPVSTTSNFSSSSSTGVPGNASAHTSCRASQPAAHEHSQAERAAAFSTFSDAPSLNSTSAPAPDVQGALTSQAARGGDGDTLSTAVCRPVPLEAFFQVRDNRPGSTSSRISLASSTASRAAADPLLSSSERGIRDTRRQSASALPISTRTLEGPVGAGTANSPSATSSGTPSILPSVTVSSHAMQRAAACGVSSGSRRLLSATGVQVAAPSESFRRGSTLSSGPQVRSHRASLGVRSTASIDERIAAAMTTSQDFDIDDSGSNAADEPPQTGTEIRVTVHEDHGNVRSHQEASQPSAEVVEGGKRRRDSATGTSASEKARRFIYLKMHEECIVCFVEIRIKGEVAMVEDCRHCFCCACLARWIKKSKTCPLCRRPVTTVELWRHARATLVKNSLAYGFLRRLRPDKNNILKPVTLPKRRSRGQRGRENKQVKAAPGARVDVAVESTRHAPAGEEA